MTKPTKEQIISWTDSAVNFANTQVKLGLCGWSDAFCSELSKLAFAAGRKAGMEEAAIIARNACLVPPDGGAPTQEEVALCDAAEQAIRSAMEADK